MKPLYFKKDDKYVKFFHKGIYEVWILLKEEPRNIQGNINNYEDVQDEAMKKMISKTIQNGNWKLDVNTDLEIRIDDKLSPIDETMRGGATTNIVKGKLSNLFRMMVKGYNKRFTRPNIFELAVDMLRATSATDIDFNNIDKIPNPMEYTNRLGFTEYLDDINVLIKLYENAVMGNMHIFNKKLSLQFKQMLTEITIFEIQNRDKTLPKQTPKMPCVSKIDESISVISTLVSTEQEHLKTLEKEMRDKLVAKRIENLKNKETKLNEQEQLIMKKQRFMKGSFEEEDKRVEEERVKLDEETKIQEEITRNFNNDMGINTETSSSMYIDNFSKTERPIPKNPDMDILYLANKKGVNIEKLDRDQKKKLLEFTTKERNFKLKAAGKEELANKMMEHDKHTIRNAINGKPEPKIPEDVEKSRFTEPETVETSGTQLSQQPSTQTQQTQQPVTQTQQTQQPVTQTQQTQQPQQPGEQVQNDTGEKSIITKINPDGNVTVTTKVLKGEDGKDFIVNADTQFKGQSGINTAINLAKKLNREKEFVNK
jgi:hypothetical protein